MSGMFMTKFKKVSPFWRRKFRRSPRLQYSVITSTGPGVRDHTMLQHVTQMKHQIFSLVFTSIDLTDPHRCRRPADWQCSCGVPSGSGSSVQTWGPPFHLNGHWLQKTNADYHNGIIPSDHAKQMFWCHSSVASNIYFRYFFCTVSGTFWDSLVVLIFFHANSDFPVQIEGLTF